MHKGSEKQFFNNFLSVTVPLIYLLQKRVYSRICYKCPCQVFILSCRAWNTATWSICARTLWVCHLRRYPVKCRIHLQGAPMEHCVCAAHDCFTRLVNSRQEHAIDALRACYIYQASKESGLLYARATFIRFLQRVDYCTRVLHSIYIHDVGLLYALLLLCVYRSILNYGQGARGCFKRVLLYNYYASPMLYVRALIPHCRAKSILARFQNVHQVLRCARAVNVHQDIYCSKQ